MESMGLQRVQHELVTFTFLDHSGLPWWLRGKASACNAGDLGSIPGSGRSPGEGNGNALQYSYWRIPWMEKPGRPQSMGLQSRT